MHRHLTDISPNDVYEPDSKVLGDLKISQINPPLPLVSIGKLLQESPRVIDFLFEYDSDGEKVLPILQHLCEVERSRKLYVVYPLIQMGHPANTNVVYYDFNLIEIADQSEYCYFRGIISIPCSNDRLWIACYDIRGTYRQIISTLYFKLNANQSLKFAIILSRYSSSR